MVFLFAAAFFDPPELFFFAAGRGAGRLTLRFAGAARRAELFLPPFFAAALRAGAFAALRFAEAFDDFFADFFDEALDEAFEADFFDDFAADFFEDLEDLAELFAEDFFALFFAAIFVSPVQKFRMGSRTF